MDPAVSEDADQLAKDLQQLSLLIKKMKYCDALDVERVIDYLSG